MLITTATLYERKIAALRDTLPRLEHVIVVDGGAASPPGTHDWTSLLERASDAFTIPPTAPEDAALLHFTSGTTGTPKGALHVHEAVVAHHATAWYALDFHPDDRFWCTADPGWVTGTSYGIVAPLAHGLTMLVDEADFDAERWYALLEEERISNWYTAPTAVRMLMKAGPELARKRDLSALRFVASVGEPLNPECVVWGQQTLGLAIHDNWWQTETGGIMIANCAALEVRPGSMGLPLPGIDAAIVRRGAGGAIEQLGADQEGELALRPGWPSMFRGVPRRGSALPQVLRRRLLPLRRPRAARSRWLVLVRGPSRRRDQVGGPPDRPLRGRERAARASGGGRGRCDRQA